MERHESGEGRVIPVILRPSYWHGLPFGRLPATPTDGKAVPSSQIKTMRSLRSREPYMRRLKS
jgi:hypothetical protein